MREIERQCVESYRQHKHLKTVGKELGIPWQTVYVHLRKVGEPVTGDKSRYGSDKDRLAARAENLFQSLVPTSKNMNREEFQSKVDFITELGYGVDVKSSRHSKKNQRWAYSIKKQEAIADFFVCFGYESNGTTLNHALLIPGEICRNYQSMSVGSLTKGKWWDYQIDPSEIGDFFEKLVARPASMH